MNSSEVRRTSIIRKKQKEMNYGRWLAGLSFIMAWAACGQQEQTGEGVAATLRTKVEPQLSR